MKRRLLLIVATLVLIGLFGSSCIFVGRVEEHSGGAHPALEGKVKNLEKRVEALENIAGVKPCLEEKCPKTGKECPLKKSE